MVPESLWKSVYGKAKKKGKTEKKPTSGKIER
jgi:hypothetical protein